MNLGPHPGYAGVFTREHAEGAFPNGSRICKADGDADDATPIGTKGVVLGSVAVPIMARGRVVGRIFYFVEWDDKPKFAVGVSDWKIAAVQ